MGLQAPSRSSILAPFLRRNEFTYNVFSHHSHRRIASEPRWRPSRQYTTALLSPECRPWLLDDSSLTVRLSGMSRGGFRVRRLWQGWQVPLLSENKLLASPARQVALVREVALMLDHRPVVFARSVFPIASLTGDLAHLRYLQNKSLGAILFKHPGMHRSPFELALMEGGSDYLPVELQQEEPAWGRRSRFVIGGRSLMVSEVFLSSFSPWTTALAVHRAQRGKVDAAIVRPSQ